MHPGESNTHSGESDELDKWPNLFNQLEKAAILLVEAQVQNETAGPAQVLIENIVA